MFEYALIAGLLASVACGIIGTYVVVKRIVFISGGIAHTAYGGVGLGYLLGFNPLLGATGFSVLAAVGIGLAHRRLGHSADTVIGVIWAVGMALGVVFIQLTPGAAPDLMTYLFGNILFITASDLLLLAALVALILLVVTLLFKEFLGISFDEEFAAVIGVAVELLELVLLVLIALTVVITIRVVGIILVIALLTLPAATSRLFVARLGPMMGLSCALAGISTAAGLAVAFGFDLGPYRGLPAGPTIIFVAALLYVVALVGKRLLGARPPSEHGETQQI